MSATRTAWIGAFGIALLASTAAWALPSVPVSRAAVTAAPELLLIRHHHRHGHWRHRRSYTLRDEEPEAARPGGDAPAALLPPPIDRPLQAAPRGANRGSGSSRPAIRWVDPERSAR